MKKVKEFELTGIDAKKVEQFFLGGYEDYLAARLLILNDLLLQGINLANTSVEKYFKGIKSITQEQVPRHHDITVSRFKNTLKNKFRRIHNNINYEFLEILSGAYKLRYFDEIEDGFEIHLYKWTFLAELDFLISSIENSFQIKKLKYSHEKNNRFLYDTSIENELLVKENYIISKTKKEIYLDRKERCTSIFKRNGNIVQIHWISEETCNNINVF